MAPHANILDRLRTGTLLFDGAMGTSIHQHDLSVEKDYCGCENCTDILSLSRPDVIQSIHESFLAAGADCLETDSFGGAPHTLKEFDIADKAFALNKAAAEVARAAAVKFSTKDKPRFVVGSMGPGTKLITLGQIDWKTMFESYREQARGLLAGGVDAFMIETCQDLLQTKCAINAVLAALDEKNLTPEHKPIMVSVTIESTGTMLLGTEIAAAATALAQFPIASLGLNCATGPTEMTEHVKWLGQFWRGSKGRPLSVLPNAGLPILHNGKTEYPLQPQPFVEAMMKFVEADGVNVVGGCCGTTPEHIKLLSRALDERQRKGGPSPHVHVSLPAAGDLPKAVTSLYSTQELRQDNSIFIIGERMNASGSRAFKRLLEAEDWDGMVALAREQVRHDGAHALDINVDYAGRDNPKDMAEVVKRVVRQVNAPLMLDSTQIKTLEAGLAHAGGKCIINSANFEEGEEKFDHICGLAKKYGAALVIGSIDEDKENSMARTRERKLAIAQRAFDRATRKHRLAPHDLLFDPLVLPVSTGMETDRRSGLETIEGVRLIARHLPDCQTTVGLSNVSFGLSPPARIVLNSVFLHELQAAGLTSAIVHFSKILPRNKIPDEQWNAALDVLLDQRDAGDPLQKFIDLFKDVSTASTKRVVKDLTIEERLREHIIDGNKENLDATIAEALKKYSPLDIINDHLLDGMKTVGELFGSGQMQLPFVLQSAEVMKLAVARLEPLMERTSTQAKGTIVLATVKGDVHDIGKNLVDIILTNNGYKVVNIGIKQPLSAMIEAWKEHNADAIGMSGLLVKSVTVMEENLREMNEAGLSPRVLLGGAALTRHYCEGHLKSIYRGEVFYGRDAFEGLRTMDLITANDTKTLHAEIAERMSKRSAAEETINQSRVAKLAAANANDERKPAERSVRVRSDVATDLPVPAAPFLGTRVVTDIDLTDIFPFINKVALYRGQWQFKKGALSDEQYEAQVADEVDPIFRDLCERCARDKILQPKVVYGYFACNSDGDDLIIYDPAQPQQRREKLRFTFPRQPDKRRLCISDFFRPVSSDQADVIGMSCVTVGHRASEETRKLFEANQYTEYLYLHGLSVETAEALAEFWHKRMRQELGIANDDSPKIKDLFTQKYRGSRYSFGYPACPDMSDQEKLFALLDPSRIGCTLTENWQIDPEQSTSAIIVHHPQAKYFNV